MTNSVKSVDKILNSFCSNYDRVGHWCMRKDCGCIMVRKTVATPDEPDYSMQDCGYYRNVVIPTMEHDQKWQIENARHKRRK